MKRFLLLTLLLLLPLTALAEDTALPGTVVAAWEECIVFPNDGQVASLLIREGQAVSAGTEAAALVPTYIYAPKSGTVTLFGDVGDDASEIMATYGAVACVEPETAYTISASILMDSCLPQNQLIHPGEQVYLCCESLCMHMGKGIVTAVEGTAFTVLVTEGEFLFGEAIDICRRGDCVGDDCIGAGQLNRVSPESCTGDGMIVAAFVNSGDYVEAGDVLLELAPTRSGHIVMNEISGVVAELCAQEGDRLKAGDALAVIWPDEAMRIAVSVPENLLPMYTVGTAVHVDFASGQHTEGRIEWVSMTAEDVDGNPAWTAHITFAVDITVRYGMTAAITPME